MASYIDVIEGRRSPGRKVAIVGAGGIGFDVAELLTHAEGHGDPIDAYRKEWGIDTEYTRRGGLKDPEQAAPPRQVTLLQRKTSKVGDGLAKTTGWAKRLMLVKRGVQMVPGVDYEKIDDAGLHIRLDGQPKVLDVDTVVICAGQDPRRELQADLEKAGIPVTLIGGADVATELDAKRAIAQGTKVAMAL